MIDDDDELRALFVVFGEEASLYEGNAHGAEVFTFYKDGGGEIEGLVFGLDVAFWNESGVDGVVCAGHERGETDAFDAGEGLEATAQLEVEGVDRSLVGVLLLREAVAGDEGVVGPVAEIDLAHLFEAAEEQAGGGE